MSITPTEHRDTAPADFTGVFTEQTRRRLRERRLALGLTYERLADALGINGSTLRKWESGTTRRCSLFCRPLIADFLSGNYDLLLRPVPVPPSADQDLASVLTPQDSLLRQTYHHAPLRPSLHERLRQMLGFTVAVRR